MYLSIINTNNLFLYVFKHIYEGRRIKIKTKNDSKTIGSHQPTLLAYKGQALRVLKKISTCFYIFNKIKIVR
jgi:hypothetical protein